MAGTEVTVLHDTPAVREVMDEVLAGLARLGEWEARRRAAGCSSSTVRSIRRCAPASIGSWMRRSGSSSGWSSA